ncbi:FAD-linked oxidase C-terminal domain-containing protein [Pullulanibacillus sp. KACC 23026]|uniref:FAD-binding oxidoreductase n=1 Tax=Pullulanibacillus sp. KACC 23026 TaxID=3028315 RepID=UPI0023B1548C|nr:FAD-linked oxidase C-terminal domain-containing protein [Pullulanibacillus sp. KACC 23026]WEG11987.1 FAD-linked oxidase C-terminal domain-containing protein [Pullulanibacillus sp. KACC 23026]
MSLLDELKQLIKDQDRVSTNETVRYNHGRDLTYHPASEPEVVVFPVNVEEVQQVVKIANTYNVAITPYGVGSSLEGHTIPVEGGITLDMSRMNQIKEIREDDFIVIVEPGVTRRQLGKALKKYGLFFPVDPGADATIGGMTATNASGTNTVGYGGMHQHVLGLEVVLASGKVITPGGLSFKSSSGYALKDLFIGSEGTLGIITEISLRVHGIPEVVQAGKALFSDVASAGRAAELLLRAGVEVKRIELVDEQTIVAVNRFSQTSYEEVPSLFIELDGAEQAVNEQVELIKQLFQDENCLSVTFERDEKKRQEMWHARHEAAMSVIGLTPGKQLTSTDVCVPISELTKAIIETRKILDRYPIVSALFGHVGDGNFHVVVAVDRDSQEEVAQYKKLNGEIIAYALSVGGTCTGEHGIGMGKKDYFYKEHDEETIQTMKLIKQALDPLNRLNPGKIFKN